MSLEKLPEYNEIIGQLYTEKIMLEEQIADMQSEKVGMYEEQINILTEENKSLRKQVLDLSNVSEDDTIISPEVVLNLRKELKDMTEKKDMYRNERYALKNEITHLNRKINRLERAKDEW